MVIDEKAGYRPSDVDDVGNSPLHLAAAGDKHLIVRALVSGWCRRSRDETTSTMPLATMAATGRRKGQRKNSMTRETRPAPSFYPAGLAHEANLSRARRRESHAGSRRCRSFHRPTPVLRYTLEAQREGRSPRPYKQRMKMGIVNEAHRVRCCRLLRRSEGRCALREQVDQVVEGGGAGTVTQRAYARGMLISFADYEEKPSKSRRRGRRAHRGAGAPHGIAGCADGGGRRARSLSQSFGVLDSASAGHGSRCDLTRPTSRLSDPWNGWKRPLPKLVPAEGPTGIGERGHKLRFACRSAELELKRSM